VSGPIAPSMKDVAARAGVSLGTVSNVLNRPEMVSERTRHRVQAAIEALGFVRNESARQLRGGGSRTLAYVVLDAANPFFTDVARGIQDAADAEGLAVYLCNSGEDRHRQAAYLDLLEQQRVEGVLITPIDAGDPRIADLARRGTPVVVVDRGAGPGHCSVTVDDVLGGDLAVTHLLDTGHERIAFIGGPRTLGQVGDRIAGAQRALARAGLSPDALTVLETSRLDVAEGRRAGERLAGLPLARRPTAAFCANDLLALGLLQQMVRLGLRVPEDMAIVGYDDIEFAEAAAVPLTSVSQPRHLLGRTAAELLLDESRGGAEHEHRQVVFDPELVVRTSTRLRPSRPLTPRPTTGTPLVGGGPAQPTPESR
jgi:LacI family transcriptional regulator